MHKKWLNRWVGMQLAVLGAELLLGMALNLWVVIPSAHPGAGDAHYFSGILSAIPWMVVHGGFLVALHILLGVLLWISGIGIVWVGWRRHSAQIWGWGLVGWIGITGAGFNGGSFLNYGLSLSSYLMTVGFVIAAAGYALTWRSGSYA